MTINNRKLSKLAEMFYPYATLYAVGGYVRDTLMDLDCTDIDLSSKLTVDEVKNVLLNTSFVVIDKNLRVGTIIIKSENFKCEYTTFRVDSYQSDSGKHFPDKVEFTLDMGLDALRRDFKMNALYLDIMSGEIIDLLGGIADINNRIITTVDAPEKVFEADGLRILRLIRFASELGFEIEKHTFEVAKQNAWRIKDIVVERIVDEIEKIMIADTAYPKLHLQDAHFKGIMLLDELGLIDMIFPELSDLKGLAQPLKYHIHDAYNHSLHAYKVAPAQIRLVALLHDTGKAPMMKLNGNMYGHAQSGADLISERMKKLKYPKSKTSHVVQLIENHMVDINGNTEENKLRWFIVNNLDIIDDLIMLKTADSMASSYVIPKSNRLKEVYEKMKGDGTPLSIKQLKVCGHDLIELGVNSNERSEILCDLLKETVMLRIENSREMAIKYLKKRIKV